MSADNHEFLVERAEKNWQTATQGDPGENTWGFYSYGDAPAGAGGGFGVFVWFPSRDEMLDFIADTLPYAPAGPSDRDWGEAARQTAAIVNDLKHRAIADATGIERLNQALASFSQIEWMGEFGQLVASHDPYPAKIRAEFFQEDTASDDQPQDGDAIPPIPSDREREFREFLESGGLT